jgi:hypothetical protein
MACARPYDACTPPSFRRRPARGSPHPRWTYRAHRPLQLCHDRTSAWRPGRLAARPGPCARNAHATHQDGVQARPRTTAQTSTRGRGPAHGAKGRRHRGVRGVPRCGWSPAPHQPPSSGQRAPTQRQAYQHCHGMVHRHQPQPPAHRLKQRMPCVTHGRRQCSRPAHSVRQAPRASKGALGA